MKVILGKKIGMTQVFRDDGTVVPVTRVEAGPCVVTLVKEAKDGAPAAVQLGFGSQKLFRVNKALQGHLKGIEMGSGQTVRTMREFSLGADHGLQRGNTVTVKNFTPGEKVQVTGTSKGKGFQGVVKRHGFSGQKATHGIKDQSRMPGSIGATGPQRVFKGMRMGGHMGDERVTVKNLEVIEIKPEANELLLKGAIPGARGSLVVISTENGKLEVDVEVVATPIDQPVTEPVTEEDTPTAEVSEDSKPEEQT